jgi:hypothetical protein
MSLSRTTVMGLLFLAITACSYDGIRMNERQRCSAVPQSQSERCYNKTRMTKSEYDAERRKATEPTTPDGEKSKPVDSRYEDWVP